MESSNIVRALEKEGWSVTERVEEKKAYRRGIDPDYTSHAFFCTNGKNQCSWSWNTESDPDGYVGSVYVKRCGAEDEIQTDYFAGTFCRTIKQTVEFMKN